MKTAAPPNQESPQQDTQRQRWQRGELSLRQELAYRSRRLREMGIEPHPTNVVVTATKAADRSATRARQSSGRSNAHVSGSRRSADKAQSTGDSGDPDDDGEPEPEPGDDSRPSNSPLDRIEARLKPLRPTDPRPDWETAKTRAEFWAVHKSTGTPQFVGSDLERHTLAAELDDLWAERRKERAGEGFDDPLADVDSEVGKVWREQRGDVFDAPAMASRKSLKRGKRSQRCPGWNRACGKTVKKGSLCAACYQRRSRQKRRSQKLAAVVRPPAAPAEMAVAA